MSDLMDAGLLGEGSQKTGNQQMQAADNRRLADLAGNVPQPGDQRAPVIGAALLGLMESLNNAPNEFFNGVMNLGQSVAQLAVPTQRLLEERHGTLAKLNALEDLDGRMSAMAARVKEMPFDEALRFTQVTMPRQRRALMESAGLDPEIDTSKAIVELQGQLKEIDKRVLPYVMSETLAAQRKEEIVRRATEAGVDPAKVWERFVAINAEKFSQDNRWTEWQTRWDDWAMSEETSQTYRQMREDMANLSGGEIGMMAGEGVGQALRFMIGLDGKLVGGVRNAVIKRLGKTQASEFWKRAAGMAAGLGAHEMVMSGDVDKAVGAMLFGPIVELGGVLSDDAMAALMGRLKQLTPDVRERLSRGGAEALEGFLFDMAPQAQAVLTNQIGVTAYDLAEQAPMLTSAWDLYQAHQSGDPEKIAMAQEMLTKAFVQTAATTGGFSMVGAAMPSRRPMYRQMEEEGYRQVDAREKQADAVALEKAQSDPGRLDWNEADFNDGEPDPSTQTVGTPSYKRTYEGGKDYDPADGIKDLVSKEDLHKAAEDLAERPIRKGGGSAPLEDGTVAYHDPQWKIIRTRKARDAAVNSHEVGHALEGRLGEKLGYPPESRAKAFENAIPEGVRHDLVALARTVPAYTDAEPPNGYVSEGIAEFVGRYMTESWEGSSGRLADEVPKAYDYMLGLIRGDKKLAKRWDRMRDLFDRYQAQGAAKRAMAGVHGNQTTAQEAKDWLKKVSSSVTWERWVGDEMAVLRRQTDQIKKIIGRDLKPSENPWRMYAGLAGKAAGRAREFFVNERSDANGMYRTGPGLKEILAPLEKRVNELGDRRQADLEFSSYWWARRTQELHDYYEKLIEEETGVTPSEEEVAARMPETGRSLRESAEIISQLETPEFSRIADELTAYARDIQQMRVDAGLISQEQLEKLTAAGEIYAPLQRYFSPDEARASAYKTHKMVGSDREIIHPLAPLMDMTHMALGQVHQNLVLKAAVKASKLSKSSVLLTPVKSADVKKEMLESVKSEFEDISDEAAETIANVRMDNFNTGAGVNRDKPIVRIFENGEPTYWQVTDQATWEALQQMDPSLMTAGAMEKVAKFITAPIRWGATEYNLRFTAKNMTRDPIAAAINSEVGGLVGRSAVPLKILHTYAMNAPEALNRKLRDLGYDVKMLEGLQKAYPEIREAGQQWRRAGGDLHSLAKDAKRGRGKRQRQDLVPKPKPWKSKNPALAWLDRLGEVFVTGVKSVNDLANFSEQQPRTAEFARALKEGRKKFGSEVEAHFHALFHASEVTNNYARMSVWGRFLNRFVPYSSAGMVGAARTLKAFRASNWKAATAMSIQYITIPTVLEFLMSHDEEWWQQLNDYERQAWWHFRIGETQVRIPKPIGVASWAFGDVPQNRMREIYQKGGIEWDELVGDLIKTVKTSSPINGASDLMGGFRALATAVSGYDFFRKRPVVSPWEEAGKVPQDIKRDYTSNFAVWLSENVWKDTSPVLIDRVMEEATGGLLTRLARTVTGTVKVDDRWRVPFFGTFVREDYFGSEKRYQQMYGAIKHLTQLKGSDLATDDERRMLVVLERMSKEISKVRKLVKAGEITAKEAASEDYAGRLWDWFERWVDDNGYRDLFEDRAESRGR